MLNPDDLVVGKTYRFDYWGDNWTTKQGEQIIGRHVCVLGKFDGVEKLEGHYWYWFIEDIGRMPFGYECLNNLREVEPCLL